jgi:hypothetical protein
VFPLTTMMGRTILAMAALALAAGCSSDPSEPTPTATPSLGSDTSSAPPDTSSAPSHVLISDRLGYMLDIPPRWTPTEGYIDWAMGYAPHRGSAPFDTILSPANDPFILIGRQDVRSGAPLEQWIDRLRATQTITYPDQCRAAHREPDTTLGGQPAEVFSLRCPDDTPNSVGVQILAVHAGSGFLFMCFSEAAEHGSPSRLANDCLDWSRGFSYGT